jgi:hypothetical protein
MNFFGHAVLASRVSSSTPFVFGAIYPDLARLLPLGEPSEVHPQIALGRAHHFDLDSMFHSLPAFVSAMSSLPLELSVLGIRRGITRAAVHVSLELYVDWYLAQDEGAVTAWRTFLQEASRPSLFTLLKWQDAADADRFENFRLRHLEEPRPPSSPERIAHRVAASIRRRPRLRVDLSESQRIAAALLPLESSMREQAHAVITELRLTFPGATG